MLITGGIEELNFDENLEYYGPMLLQFLATLLKKNSIPKDVLLISQLIERVLKNSTRPPFGLHSQVEEGVIELLRLVPELDLNHILSLARPIPFSQICSYIYHLTRNFEELIECLLESRSDSPSVFDVAHQLLGSSTPIHLTVDEIERVRNHLKLMLNRLAEFNSLETARMVLDFFGDWITKLKNPKQELPFTVLRDFFRICKDRGLRSVCGIDEVDERLFTSLFIATIECETNNPNHSQRQTLDDDLAELLHYWLPNGSRTDHCLNAAMEYSSRITDESQQLLETNFLLLRARHFPQRAFDLIYTSIQHELHRLMSCSKEGNFISTKRFDRQLEMAVELASTNATESRKSSWLVKIFQALLTASLTPENSTDQKNESVVQRCGQQLTRVFSAIIESGGVNDVQRAFSELFSYPTFRDAPYSTFAPLITKMLLWCHLETVMLKNVVKCIQLEMTSLFARHHIQRGVGLFAASETHSANTCICCGEQIIKSFILFECGHVIHLECIDHITLSSDEQRNNNFLFSKFVDVIAGENDEERSQRQRRQRICPCHSDIRRTLLFKHSHSHSGNYQLTNNHHLSDQNEFIRNGSIINIFEHLFQRPTN